MECKIKDFKVLELPARGVPNARYYVPNGDGTNIDEYLTDINGNYRRVSASLLASNYTHTQSIPSATWDITHNLGFHPSITIVDSSGRVVEGEEQYITTNIVRVTFSGAFSGKAYLS
jgi:hypothetical protein